MFGPGPGVGGSSTDQGGEGLGGAGGVAFAATDLCDAAPGFGEAAVDGRQEQVLGRDHVAVLEGLPSLSVGLAGLFARLRCGRDRVLDRILGRRGGVPGFLGGQRSSSHQASRREGAAQPRTVRSGGAAHTPLSAGSHALLEPAASPASPPRAANRHTGDMLLAGFLLTAAALPQEAPVIEMRAPLPQPPRTIVLVLVDDLGWSDLGCCGSGYYETPHIDRLAAEGMRFTQAYASCAVCSPTRAAVQTGRAPARLGITDWIHHSSALARRAVANRRHAEGFEAPPQGKGLLTPVNRHWLDHDEISLAELLAPAGYRGGYVGKWHLGPVGWLPQDQGYAFNAGGCRFGQPPSYFDPYTNRAFPGGIPGLPPRQEGEYLTAREADEAIGFLERAGDAPAFLFYAPYAVHSPIQAPFDVTERFQAKPPTHHDQPAYAAMIAELDDAVGRILAALERLGRLERSLIVFTSDNGGASHFPATDNAPLRKGKGFPYEGGLRVPLLVRWPGAAKPGSECRVPVISTDLFPSLADAARAKVPRDRAYDGVSLLPLLQDPAARFPSRPLVWHFPHYWWGGRLTPYSVVRDGDWKLIHQYEDGRDELYDLVADPSEQRDLAGEQPERVEALRRTMLRELYRQGARFPAPIRD